MWGRAAPTQFRGKASAKKQITPPRKGFRKKADKKAPAGGQPAKRHPQAPNPQLNLSGTGTFSTTAIKIRSAEIPFILASGLGVMRCASTGSTMRCTSSGRM